MAKLVRYENPSLTDIFHEVFKIKDFDSFMYFYEVMPTWVDWVTALSIIGVVCGAWVLLMGVLCDNDE